MELTITLNQIIEYISLNPELSSSIIVGIGGIVGTALFSYKRRPKSTEKKLSGLFKEEKLLTPPTARPAYSDRTAYVMAEFSELAYFKFEGSGGAILDAAERLKKLEFANLETLTDFLTDFSFNLVANKELSLTFLKAVLKSSGFELIDAIAVRETQAIACKRVKEGEPPFIVVAFRGTEDKVSDWLTDASAKPTEIGDCKIHTGFYTSFHLNKGEDEKTIYERVNDILSSKDAIDTEGKALPVFFTGHSLGGALALMATKAFDKSINGACYTFGAPRIANYEFFDGIKTPVFRIVNSSDVVPRVPPGAPMILIIKLVRLLSWFTALIPLLSNAFKKLEAFLDKLNGYRHHGDMRYLTDVASGRFQDVRLLTNPPAIDLILWAWQHLAAGFFFPLKSHSMAIYRKKLHEVAMRRNS